MNFAPMLTNTGESLVYVVIILIGIHLFFNFKIDIFLRKRNRRKVAPENMQVMGSASESRQSERERHLSNALNYTLHLVRQQSSKMMGAVKLKPTPSPGSRESFLAIGKLVMEKVQDADA